MNFPSDHYWHSKAPAEWVYFWGKMDNGSFYHFAEFIAKFGSSRTNFRHWSLDGKFEEEIDKWNGEYISKTGFFKDRFTLHSPKYGLTLFPKSEPIDHRLEDSNYYSITNLEGDGHIYPDKKIRATGWFDHHWFDYDSKGEQEWDWVGICLDCGIYIICGHSKNIRYCNLDYRGNLINSDFTLKRKHLSVKALGMDLILKPLKKEAIFKPTLGFNYSEQPFNVMSKFGVIGYGMRERTYTEVS